MCLAHRPHSPIAEVVKVFQCGWVNLQMDSMKVCCLQTHRVTETRRPTCVCLCVWAHVRLSVCERTHKSTHNNVHFKSLLWKIFISLFAHKRCSLWLNLRFVSYFARDKSELKSPTSLTSSAKCEQAAKTRECEIDSRLSAQLDPNSRLSVNPEQTSWAGVPRAKNPSSAQRRLWGSVPLLSCTAWSRQGGRIT